MQSADNTIATTCDAPVVVLASESKASESKASKPVLSKQVSVHLKKGQHSVPTINITEPHLKLNQVLGKLHRSLIPKPGKIRVDCHGLVCFPADTPDGIRMAKELGEKWSDSFYNGRKDRDGTPKHDFKDA